MAAENGEFAQRSGDILAKIVLGSMGAFILALAGVVFSNWAGNFELRKELDAFTAAGGRYPESRGDRVEKRVDRNRQLIERLDDKQDKIRERVVTYQERTIEKDKARDRDIQRLQDEVARLSRR